MSKEHELIRRLSDELHLWQRTASSWIDTDAQKSLIAEARDYLAQPQTPRPSVMEIIALADEVEEEGLGQVDLVRRALARWGQANVTTSA